MMSKLESIVVSGVFMISMIWYLTAESKQTGFFGFVYSLLLLPSVLLLVAAVIVCCPRDLPADGLKDRWKIRIILTIRNIINLVGGVVCYFGFACYTTSTARMYNYLLSIGQSYLGVIEFDDAIEGVKVKIFKPTEVEDSDELIPGVVYIHGGGWTSMSTETHRRLTSLLCKHLNKIVISISYSVVPEVHFPQPVDECLKVTKYLLNHGDHKYRIKRDDIIIAGDDVGANMAAVIAQELRNVDDDTPRLTKQILIDPVLQFFDFELASHVENDRYDLLASSRSLAHRFLFYVDRSPFYATEILRNRHVDAADREKYGYLVDRGLSTTTPEPRIHEYTPHSYQDLVYYYHGDATPGQIRPPVTRRLTDPVENDAIVAADLRAAVLDPRVAPLMRDDLDGLPPAVIVTSRYSITRDDGSIYGRRLESAGVKVVSTEFEQTFHGHLVYAHVLESARDNAMKLIELIR
ncbi:arylacetamide deacetylase-like [Tubulanus polymorphus]|uniref:arylacetamide deacetylase-like n=1 Tax=Tubulanus polymorphus TaxID=672921 RepID=UPI003DA5BD90